MRTILCLSDTVGIPDRFSRLTQRNGIFVVWARPDVRHLRLNLDREFARRRLGRPASSRSRLLADSTFSRSTKPKLRARGRRRDRTYRALGSHWAGSLGGSLLKQPSRAPLRDQIAYEGGAGTEHEQCIGLVDLRGILIKEGVADTPFVASEAIESRKAFLHGLMDRSASLKGRQGWPERLRSRREQYCRGFDGMNTLPHTLSEPPR